MKIKNLADYPQQLGDGRIVGAAGTKQETREYDLDELTREDKQRVKNETLMIVEEVAPKPVEANKANPTEAESSKTFEKNKGEKK